ncbi:MAG: hypothetical protein ACE5K9_11885 [Candidatus Methylomirabilales bacterium]
MGSRAEDGSHPERRIRLGRYAATFWVLALLFFLRVLGQVLVAFFDVTFLPPMAEWYSGLLPYPILLPVQILILMVQAKIGTDFSREYGFFVIPRRAMGRFLRWFSYLYFASMVLRYVISMGLYPERRWFGGTIPIFFHWVLAAYLFVLGHYHTRRDSHEGPVDESND